MLVDHFPLIELRLTTPRLELCFFARRTRHPCGTDLSADDGRHWTPLRSTGFGTVRQASRAPGPSARMTRWCG